MTYLRNLDDGKTTVLVLLDLPAFDTLDHSGVISLLGWRIGMAYLEMPSGGLPHI